MLHDGLSIGFVVVVARDELVGDYARASGVIRSGRGGDQERTTLLFVISIAYGQIQVLHKAGEAIALGGSQIRRSDLVRLRLVGLGPRVLSTCLSWRCCSIIDIHSLLRAAARSARGCPTCSLLRPVLSLPEARRLPRAFTFELTPFDWDGVVDVIRVSVGLRGSSRGIHRTHGCRPCLRRCQKAPVPVSWYHGIRLLGRDRGSGSLRSRRLASRASRDPVSQSRRALARAPAEARPGVWPVSSVDSGATSWHSSAGEVVPRWPVRVLMPVTTSQSLPSIPMTPDSQVQEG